MCCVLMIRDCYLKLPVSLNGRCGKMLSKYDSSIARMPLETGWWVQTAMTTATEKMMKVMMIKDSLGRLQKRDSAELDLVLKRPLLGQATTSSWDSL